MNGFIKVARDLQEAGEAFIVARLVDTKGSTPRSKGAWMIVRRNAETEGTIGGGALEGAVCKMAAELFQTKQSVIQTFHLNAADQMNLDMRCGGDAEVSLEYVPAGQAASFRNALPQQQRALIFGGGHIGKAIEPLLRTIGFSTVVADDRSEFANRERFPEAEDVRVIRDYPSAFAGIETDAETYVIIVTRGHRGDQDVLEQALKRPCAYIGMIGSRGKVAHSFNLLRQKGFSEEQITRVHSPIGLSIGAETPEEIAVSIAAEMIRVRATNGK